MNRALIIAEAGVNHNGNLDLAYQLVDAAAYAGADYIKFQTWKSEQVVSKFTEKANYQKNHSDSEESMLDMVKKLEFPFEYFQILKEYCRKKEIGFLSAPFDMESIRFLFSIGMDMVKIPSGEITNLPFLEEISKYHHPVLLSTGMCEIEEIESALKVLKRNENKKITVLHCNTQYPTPMEDVNLQAMLSLRKHLRLPVGLSDHSVGTEVPIAAAALGANVIEKHLTLSRFMEGPDHKASMEPEEFRYMVKCVRNIELALGSGEKHVTNSERENRLIARKSIVAARHIRRGEILTPDNLAVKRPGTGISPMRWNEIIGRKTLRDYDEDEMIVDEFEFDE